MLKKYRNISFLLAVLFVMSMFPAYSHAITEDEYEYTLYDNKATLTKYTGAGGNVAIPDVIEGCEVANIGSYAFNSITSITTVYIPKSILNIGNRAFSGCANIERYTVDPENTKYASDNGVLFDKDKTTLIQYPAGDKRISYSTPEGVSIIGEAAFSNCQYLNELVLTNDIKNVVQWGFVSATSLKSLVISNGLEFIEYRAFISTPNLNEISVSEGNENFTGIDGVLFSKDKTELIQYPCAASADEYIIPEGVKRLDGYAFYNCNKLKNIALPDSLIEIGYATFEHCYGLSDVKIPDSVEIIGTWAYTKCYSLKNVYIGKGIKTIYSNAFMDSAYLENIHFASDTPPAVGGSAFFGMKARAVVPDGCINFGDEGSMWNGLCVTYASSINTTANSFLAKLNISKGILTPAFAPEIFNYYSEVDYEVDNITIDALPEFPLATITGNGKVSLNLWSNYLTVSVTSCDMYSARYYNITIYRNSAKNNNADNNTGGNNTGSNTGSNTGGNNNTGGSSTGGGNNTGGKNSGGDNGITAVVNGEDEIIGASFIPPMPSPTPSPFITPAAVNTKSPGPAPGQTTKPGRREASVSGIYSSMMSDIYENYWAAEYINSLVEFSIINGYPQPDGSFMYMPENEISRAELMKLICATLGLELVYEYDGSGFADWDLIDDWAKPYIAALINEKIVMGSQEADGVFMYADSNVTREEMIVMAVRALGANASGGAKLTPDIGDVSDWALDGVLYAIENDMINIYPDGCIKPQANAKRSETAMVLYKLLMEKPDLIQSHINAKTPAPTPNVVIEPAQTPEPTVEPAPEPSTVPAIPENSFILLADDGAAGNRNAFEDTAYMGMYKNGNDGSISVKLNDTSIEPLFGRGAMKFTYKPSVDGPHWSGIALLWRVQKWDIPDPGLKQYSSMSFWVRGSGGTVKFFIEGGGYAQRSEYVSLTDEWQYVTIEPGPWDYINIPFGWACNENNPDENGGTITFWIDGLHFH